MEEKIIIPKERENLNTQDFKRQLEQRKLTKKQEEAEKYSELKYNIISFCCTKGIIIAIILWLTAYFTNHTEIKYWCGFYLQTLITLYIGSLLSKKI